MHGNVFEWCHDAYLAVLQGGEDPVVTEGSYRVIRGGSFGTRAFDCRSADRSTGFEPDYQYYVLGFRVAIVKGDDSKPTF